ncbi:MAG: 3'-5' exonuclease [Solirubrobacterales bacterium]
MSGARTRGESAYLSASVPAPSTPWREAAYSVVDLELTGVDSSVHEIVSYATVTVAGGRIRLDDARYRVVRPSRMPDADTTRIHGLRESDLAGAPPLEQVLDDLLEALTGRVLVAHAAAIEEAFLRTVLETHGLTLRNPVVDTAGLALELRRLRRQPPLRPPRAESSGIAVSSPGLSEVARSLGLPVHRPHHADGDALTAAQAFIALATHLDRLQPQTVGSLQRLSAPKRERVTLRSGLGRLRRRLVSR